MSKRMQIIMDDKEFRDIQLTAKANNMTVAEWVRQVLRAARRAQAKGNPARRLDVVREAARHSYPTGDIGQVLDDIEKGYGSGELP
jgi:hypothetical protein